ncbi:MAG: DUF3987 domain-containing protein, partial [Gaiellaceae bacterium]
MGALGVLASVAMNARVDCVNWDEETLGLYLLVASPTGDRKSTIMKKVAAPLYRLEREAQQDAIAARARWESEREILQARKQAIVKKLNKLKDDADPEEEVWGEAQAELEQISAELARIGEFPEPGMIAGDSTPEALVDLMAEQKDGVAVLAAEAAPIDNLFGRYSDDGNSNLSAVCEAYTADPIRVGRRGRPKVVISR